LLTQRDDIVSIMKLVPGEISKATTKGLHTHSYEQSGAHVSESLKNKNNLRLWLNIQVFFILQLGGIVG